MLHDAVERSDAVEGCPWATALGTFDPGLLCRSVRAAATDGAKIVDRESRMAVQAVAVRELATAKSRIEILVGGWARPPWESVTRPHWRERGTKG